MDACISRRPPSHVQRGRHMPDEPGRHVDVGTEAQGGARDKEHLVGRPGEGRTMPCMIEHIMSVCLLSWPSLLRFFFSVAIKLVSDGACVLAQTDAFALPASRERDHRATCTHVSTRSSTMLRRAHGIRQGSSSNQMPGGGWSPLGRRGSDGKSKPTDDDGPPCPALPPRSASTRRHAGRQAGARQRWPRVGGTKSSCTALSVQGRQAGCACT